MSTITSLGIGSGLDLNGLLDQLRDAERGRLQPIAQQKEAQQAKLSAYGKLQGALSSLQSAADTLNGSALFGSLSSSVTGTSVTSAADSNAVPGRYDVSVTTLARAQSIATGGFAEGETFSAGTMSIQAGDADPLNVTVAEGDSLEAIRDSINAAGSGITASIVNDGDETNPYRLVLSTNETGTNAAIQSISFTGGDERLSFEVEPETGYVEPYAGMRETVAAEDAALTVNGIVITSQSNQVEGAIQGVTLSLAEEGDSANSTVIVERDNFAVRDAISGFVDAFNSLKETTADLTSFNAETGAAGELLGDSALRTIDSRLRGVLGGIVSGGDFSTLSDIGISLQRDGTLEIDAEKLDDAVVNQRQALTTFFAGDTEAGGFAGALSEMLDQVLDDRGLLGSARSGVESRITSLDERSARMEISIEREIERYRVQFGQLDSMIAQMNQTSTYLTQQFDNLNSMLGRDN
ncbi:flagellar filament capping protein FliD [Lamprobacter modestohalophilus]|uniref:Flagellar hook-associated protein 2 n=1 Tax=Lamprobacter modestohalophilus TaxID=1064514 RepID=A0A9X1B772_9GAMM|nr:flagellar filament capping protein FliD [Lamprobacter modestohalophilus]MBK1621512.1 flagellar filament capping protein FliD [Lamprobacter modestohalophilus]